MSLEPVRQSVTVGRPPEVAFKVFTEDFGRWWPLGRFSVSLERAETSVLECRPGGAVYEVRDDGERFPWGRVLAWDPPERLVLSWHPGRDPEVAQELELRFRAVAEGPLVELEHRGWEGLGEEAESVRSGYEQGWPAVLGQHFASGCDEPAEVG